MSKTILAIFMTFAAANAHAECSVNAYTTSASVRAVLHENGPVFKKHNELCNKLQKANAKLVLAGGSSIQGNLAIGWVNVSLMDNDLNIATSDYGGVSIKTNSEPTQDRADGMLVEAIDEAVSRMSLDEAIKSLNSKRQEIKQSFAAI